MTRAGDEDPVDPQFFRSVFGLLPTGVAIIGTHTPSGPFGMTVGTLSSVSLDPPLLGFMPHANATIVARIADAGGMFSASILASHQEAEARRMAASGRPEGHGSWTSSPRGLPIFAGCVAWIEARLEDVLELGDHKLVVGRVLDLSPHAEGDPLVFYRGRFHAISS